MKKTTAEIDRLLNDLLLAKVELERLKLRLEAQKRKFEQAKMALLFGGKAESILEIERLLFENERIVREQAKKFAVLVDQWVHLHVLAFVELQQWRILSHDFEEYDGYQFHYVIAADVPRVQAHYLFQDFFRLSSHFRIVGKVVIQFNLETANDSIEVPYAEVCCA